MRNCSFHENYYREATQNDVAEILSLRLAVGASMQERYGDDSMGSPDH
jgi:hypothetical protein